MSKLMLSICVLLIFFTSHATYGKRSETQLKEFLKQDCGSCHGMSLRGGLGLALTKDRMSSLPESYLFSIIKEGKTNTAMPPWKNILSDEEIRIIIKFLKEGV